MKSTVATRKREVQPQSVDMTDGYVSRFARERQERLRVEQEYAALRIWYRGLTEEQRREYHVQLNGIYQ